MIYTVLESHAYDNVLVMRYFCTTTNFSHTYVRTYSDLSNPDDLLPWQISDTSIFSDLITENVTKRGVNLANYQHLKIYVLFLCSHLLEFSRQIIHWKILR